MILPDETGAGSAGDAAA